MVLIGSRSNGRSNSRTAERLTPLHLRPSLLAGLLMMYTGRFAESRELLARYIADAMEGGGDGTDGPRLLSWVAWMEAMNGQIELRRDLSPRGRAEDGSAAGTS